MYLWTGNSTVPGTGRYCTGITLYHTVEEKCLYKLFHTKRYRYGTIHWVWGARERRHVTEISPIATLNNEIGPNFALF